MVNMDHLNFAVVLCLMAGHKGSAVVAPADLGHGQHTSSGVLPGCTADTQSKGWPVYCCMYFFSCLFIFVFLSACHTRFSK